MFTITLVLLKSDLRHPRLRDKLDRVKLHFDVYFCSHAKGGIKSSWIPCLEFLDPMLATWDPKVWLTGVRVNYPSVPCVSLDPLIRVPWGG